MRRRHGPRCECRWCRGWARAARPPERQVAAKLIYTATCDDCTEGHLVLSFDTAGERNRWAVEHAMGLGHAVSLHQRERVSVAYPEGPAE